MQAAADLIGHSDIGRREVMGSAVYALALAAAGCTAERPGNSHPADRHPRSATTNRRQDEVTEFVVSGTGDLLIHTPVWERALALGGGRRYNFAPLFDRVRPFIRAADLRLCHVETPMTAAPPTSYPVFNTPPELATAIRQTGWHAASTASNHTLDQGQHGDDDTIRYLDRAGIRHTGSYASAAARRKPLIMTVKGIRVAFLAYTEWTNGIPLPHPWSVNLASAERILADARHARMDGAQVVIVNLHWGIEFVSEPSAFQFHLADKLTQSPDITAVIGQHAHVPQPIRFINGKAVVFGEGNLISDETIACCAAATQDGMVVLLHITVDSRGARVTHVRYVPIWVRHPDFLVLPAGFAWRTDHADAEALRESYLRTVSAVGRSSRVQPVPAHLSAAQ